VDHGGPARHGQDVVGEQGTQRQVGDVSGRADDGSLGRADQLVVGEGSLVSVEALARLERERVVAALGIGELDLVPDLEGPAAAGGTGRFGHDPQLRPYPEPGRRGDEGEGRAMASRKARSTSRVESTP